MLRRRIAKMISVAAVYLDEHAVVGYLASFAMTAVATVVAVGVEQRGDDPEPLPHICSAGDHRGR
jgi:hypothetical protein